MPTSSSRPATRSRFRRTSSAPPSSASRFSPRAPRRSHYNVLLLLGMFLSAMSAWALARYVTGDPAASLLAGVVYAFVPWRLAQLPHVQFQWGAFLRLLLLFLLRYLDAGGGADAVLFGVFFAWNALCNVHYAVFSGVLVILVLAHGALARGPRAFRSRWKGAVLAVGIAGIAVLPLFVPYAKASKLYGMVRGEGEIEHYSGRPIDFLSAGPQNKLYAPLTQKWAQAEGDFFPGLVPFGLAAFALIRLRRVRPGAQTEQPGPLRAPVPGPCRCSTRSPGSAWRSGGRSAPSARIRSDPCTSGTRGASSSSSPFGPDPAPAAISDALQLREPRGLRAAHPAGAGRDSFSRPSRASASSSRWGLTLRSTASSSSPLARSSDPSACRPAGSSCSISRWACSPPGDSRMAIETARGASRARRAAHRRRSPADLVRVPGLSDRSLRGHPRRRGRLRLARGIPLPGAAVEWPLADDIEPEHVFRAAAHWEADRQRLLGFRSARVPRLDRAARRAPDSGLHLGRDAAAGSLGSSLPSDGDDGPEPEEVSRRGAPGSQRRAS